MVTTVLPGSLTPVSKQLPLSEAISGFVRPGMTLHLAGGIGGPGAAMAEIIRQFHSKAPAFTVILSTVTGHALSLIHAKLVKKVVCAVCAEISTTARPAKVVQRAYAEGSLELENWSLLSLQQRLMAGAYGVPFMPTRSLLGSSIASDNADSFQAIVDPFGSGSTTGIVKALTPDLSIVHGCVSDAQGNTLLLSPTGEDQWGPFAAKEGVIAVVEKLVATDYIRAHSSLTKIPGHLVRAVCVAPFGLHPYSCPNPGIPDFEPYEMDVSFLHELGSASKSPAALDAWLDKWILGNASHEEYLKSLGKLCLTQLASRSRRPALSPSAEVQEAPRTAGPPATTMMLIAAAREIVRIVRTSGYKTILAGAGIGANAAFLAHSMLIAEGYELDLVTGNGQIGYTPVIGEPILATEVGVRSSKMLTDTVTAQGLLVGGANNRCLSVLGAGQIDKFGNINSTLGADGQFLVGSGGANDALSACESIVLADQSRDRFVDKLSYVTGVGSKVSTVVSSLGVMRKDATSRELRLIGCFSTVEETDLPAKISAISNNCGWMLAVSPDVVELPQPSLEELKCLSQLSTRTITDNTNQ